MGTPKLEIRDSDYNVVGDLPDFISFNARNVFNGKGTWDLEVHPNSTAAQLLTQNAGIVFSINNITKFSGSVATAWEKSANVLHVAGFCDNALLDTPARPTPSQNGPPFTDAYDVRVAQASTLILDLVDVNIGPSAPSSWQIPNLDLDTDPLLGTTLVSRTNLDPLIVILQELASTPIATGLGFKVLHSDIDAGRLVFQVYEPVDRTETIKFSLDLNNTRDFTDKRSNPPYNHVYVLGGDNFGLSRTIIAGEDSAAIALVGRRISIIIDKRGVTDLSELEQELAEALALAVTTRTVDIEPLPVYNIEYGIDYDLGDLITFVVDGDDFVDLIREVHISITPESGLTVIPVIGEAGSSNTSFAAQHIDAIQNRLSYIERNWNVPNDSIIEDMIHPFIKTLPGDIKLTGRSSAQDGWLICDGSAISRSVYSRLFDAIGTTFGVGNNSTTFNIPDLRGRFPLGPDGSHALGTSGGTFTPSVSIAQSHSHGMNNHTHSSQAHTHPGTHSHGLVAHRHEHDHTHNVTGSPTSTSNRADGANSVASATHQHGSTSAPSNNFTNSGEATSGGAAFTSTEGDSNVFAASYSGSPSGPSPSSTEADTNPVAGTITVTPPYQVVNYEIYYGPIPS